MFDWETTGGHAPGAPLVSHRHETGPILEVDVILVLVQEAVHFAIAADGGKTRQRLREVRV